MSLASRLDTVHPSNPQQIAWEQKFNENREPFVKALATGIVSKIWNRLDGCGHITRFKFSLKPTRFKVEWIDSTKTPLPPFQEWFESSRATQKNHDPKRKEYIQSRMDLIGHLTAQFLSKVFQRSQTPDNPFGKCEARYIDTNQQHTLQIDYVNLFTSPSPCLTQKKEPQRVDIVAFMIVALCLLSILATYQDPAHT
jgi:hypothetical protein